MTASDTPRGPLSTPAAGTPAEPPPADLAPAPAPVQLRQGDVLLVPVDEAPVGAQQVRRAGTRVILAEGEATGHAHAIRSPGATLFEADGDRFLRVTAPVTLDHEEHAALEVATGTYRVVIQREYVPPEVSSIRFRRVLD